ncbi:MAG: substrate-binding domain-containing protein [Capsulimonadaceae bacterium]|nr:substrate-binding domain-containing protein [Capsulimonadaceae bacterium]
MGSIAASTTTKDIHATRSSRVALKMIAAVEAGLYAPGMLLPARRVLAQEYGVSLATMEIAIKSLIGNGLLRAEHGRGTFVREDLTLSDRPRIAPLDAHPPIEREPAARQGVNRLVLGIISYLDPNYLSTHLYDNRDVTVVIGAFERFVTDLGGITHFTNTDGHPQTPGYVRDAICGMVEEFGIQGVLITAPKFQFDPFAAALLSPVPVVVVEGQYSAFTVHQVYCDNREEGYRAAKVLLAAGHERLVYFAPYFADWVSARQTGIADAVASADIPLTAHVDIDAMADTLLFNQFEVARKFAESVTANDIAGSGVVACNDDAAVALMKRMATQGLTAGVDYSIVGFDDSHLARECGLATFRPPLRLMGERAANVLANLVAHRDCPMRTCLQSELVMRYSVKSSPLAIGKPAGYAVEAVASY